MMDEAICTCDEGFMAGIFDSLTGKAIFENEAGCWCTGERTCLFEVKPA
jgi:predicted hydrocarbon binding protein